MGGSQRVRPAHFFVADKCLHVFLSKKTCLHVFLSKKHVFMSCHANVCTIELCVYASFCYEHISIWRKFARIQFKSNFCVSK